MKVVLVSGVFPPEHTFSAQMGAETAEELRAVAIRCMSTRFFRTIRKDDWLMALNGISTPRRLLATDAH